MYFLVRILIFALSPALAGCLGISPEYADVDFAGSGPLFSADQYTELALCNELIRFDLAKRADEKKTWVPQVSQKLPLLPDFKQPVIDSCTIDEESKAATSKAKRSFVGYVMGLSDTRCGVYKQKMLARRAAIGTLTQSMATLFAGAGSVIAHAPSAKAFSAAAGAAGAIDAVDRQEKFANLAVEVIAAGIDQRRKEIRTDTESRFGNDQDYTVGDAVKDVMRYHAACNALTGLEVAKESISRVDSPGVSEFFRIVNTLREAGVTIEVESKAE